MGTLWNVDNTGNLTVGTIGTRTLQAINQNVLPFTRVNSGTFSGSLNTVTSMFFGSSWTYNFPSGGQPGDRVEVFSEVAGGTIQLPSLNLVKGANSASTLAGTLTTTDQPASIRLMCNMNSGQTEWLVENVTGNWLVSGSPSNFYINGVFGGTVSSPLSVAGQINANAVTASTTITNGCLVTQGGVGVNGNLNAIGLGLKGQTNGYIGTASMSSGSALVPNTAISSNSFPFAISNSSTVTGALRIINITTGVGFTIQSSVGSDSGQVLWFVLSEV